MCNDELEAIRCDCRPGYQQVNDLLCDGIMDCNGLGCHLYIDCTCINLVATAVIVALCNVTTTVGVSALDATYRVDLIQQVSEASELTLKLKKCIWGNILGSSSFETFQNALRLGTCPHFDL